MLINCDRISEKHTCIKSYKRQLLQYNSANRQAAEFDEQNFFLLKYVLSHDAPEIQAFKKTFLLALFKRYHPRAVSPNRRGRR